MVLLHPKEVPLCLTGTVSKICWRFCTGTRRQRLTRSHSIVGALSMAICQWDLKSTVWATGVSSLTLVEGLGGAQKILDVNYYKHSHASLCLVLPPVGSARSAILLLLVYRHFIGSALFSNPEIQIQVCSPGRLGTGIQLGVQFQEEMEALLERHVLNGLVDAPWVRTDDPESDDDDGFLAALQELVAYAFEESVRMKKKGRLFPGWPRDTSQVISRNSAGSAVFASEVLQ